jgi:hypothetical protein
MKLSVATPPAASLTATPPTYYRCVGPVGRRISTAPVVTADLEVTHEYPVKPGEAVSAKES